MTTLLVIIWIVFVSLFVIVAAIRPERTRHSWFELKRRGDETAMRRERLLGGITALRVLIIGLLVVPITAIGIVLWQGWGVVATIAVVLLCSPLSQVRSVTKVVRRLYAAYEAPILHWIEQVPLLRWISGTQRFLPYDQKLESSEQLLHLIESSQHVLSDDQQTIIRHGLDWHTTAVEKVMTPRKDIVTIKHSELLGPLVLDDLHRSGHNRFPVIKGTLDTVIGVLDITELLEVSGGKNSLTAEKSMSAQALRIESDKPLPDALKLLQKSRQHVLIVINDEGKTVGLVTLADITGSLLGS